MANPNSDNKATKPKLHALRTLKTDLAETLKSGKTSVTKVFLNQKREKIEQGKAEKYTNKKLLYSFIALAISAAAVFVFFFATSNSHVEENKNPAKPRAIILSDQEIDIGANDKVEFENKFSSLLKKTYNAGDLIYIRLKTNNQYLNAKNFLVMLGAKTPPLVTSFLTDRFQLGVLNLETNYPFIIFEIQKGEYDNAFAGMLRWEKQLPQDLNFIVKKPIPDPVVFTDKIVKNQGVRLLKNSDDEEILLYSLFNKKYIIITNSENSFEEIIKRIQLYY